MARLKYSLLGLSCRAIALVVWSALRIVYIQAKDISSVGLASGYYG